MKSFFERNAEYTSTLRREEIEMIINNLLSTKSKVLMLDVTKYKGSFKKNKFNFYKKFNHKYGLSNPKIKGEFISENPLKLNLRITPHYFRILFFLIFPLVFIPTAIITDEMTINGVLREPTLVERFSFAAVGGIMPLIWGYNDTFSKYDKTETWIKDLLKLKK